MPHASLRRRLSPWSLAALMALAGCGEGGEPAPTTEGAPLPGQLLALTDGAPRVVLAEPLPEGIARGPVTLASSTGIITLRRGVEPRAASAEQLAWLGRRVRLSGAVGEVCEGSVIGLAVEARVMPEGVLDDEGAGDEADPGEAPRTPESLWELASTVGRVALVADVAADAPCDGALWAEDAGRAPRVTLALRDADDETSAAALAAFRALPTWEEAATRWIDDAAARDAAPADAIWDSVGGPPSVRLVEGAALVVVTKDTGGGCGEFDGSITAVFRVLRGPRGASVELVNDPSTTRAFDVLGAVDLDGDGALELLVPGGFRRGALLDDAVTGEVPFVGCPC